MEIGYQVVLWGVRLAFLLLLYLFLIRAFASLWRALRIDAAMSSKTALAFLAVQRAHARGPRVGERLPLRPVSSLGRDPGNDVVIEDDAASARHALIELTEGEWWVEDQGSTNGTLLNGERVSQRQRLRDGDVLEIGRVALRFEGAAK